MLRLSLSLSLFLLVCAAQTPTSRRIAEEYLKNAHPAADLTAAYVAKEYRSSNNGVTHFVFAQRFQGIDVANASYTVNIDADGNVIAAGGALYRAPRAGAKDPDAPQAFAAVRRGAAEVNRTAARRFTPFEIPGNRKPRSHRFSRGEFAEDIEAEPVWFPVRGELNPAWRMEIVDPDSVHAWSVIVDARGNRVLHKRSLTHFQKALVFDPSPQPNPKPGTLLTKPPALAPRVLRDLTGDPIASPAGWVTGNSTSGNNVIAGTNVTGVQCWTLNCLTPPIESVAPNRDFSFPLDLTPGALAVSNYADAATANMFYWANRAHDFFYEYGFDEAAGNYQQDNFGRGGIGGDPIVAYSHFGVASFGRANLDVSDFFTTRGDDGSQARIALGLFQTEQGMLYEFPFDAQVVVHEYTHGVSHRLVRDIDASYQGAAMGEAWSDFFGLEMTLPEGADPNGYYPIAEYGTQTFGSGLRTRPYTTDSHVNPLTYEHLGRVFLYPEVHSDGEIWAEALWEARAALIAQFGEREGRRRIRQLVIDGMKLSLPAPSMVDARDAILLADRVDFKGASQDQLWAAFAKRGLGAAAQSGAGASVHVSPSFKPAGPGAMLSFFESKYVIGETVRVVLQDAKLTGGSVLVQLTGSSGDVENLLLRRRGVVYTAAIDSFYGPVVRKDNAMELIPGDLISAYYADGKNLVQTTVPVSSDYSVSTRAQGFSFRNETPLDLHFSTFQDVTLPFEFPYFDKKYSRVWIDQSGLISFGVPNYSACTDAGALQTLNAIAPMWMPLTTGGFAQRSEDVYMSTGPDSVTFRWAGETLPDFSGVTPEAVNFAATLYRDGRIVFQYGAGNRNLSGGSQYFGCSFTGPTVAISNGHETFLQPTVTHDGRGTLENARTVVFDPPFNFSTVPVGILESPAAGTEVQDIISGKGVVYDPDPEGYIRRVDTLIDGLAVDVPDIRLARNDFCGTQRVQGCPNIGIQFSDPLSLMGLKPGDHTLQFRVTNHRGAFTDFPEKPLPFKSAENPAVMPFGAIERPAPNTVLTGRVTLSGYAASPQRRILEIDVLVDGVTWGIANYGAARADVCGGLSTRPPDCPRVGFTFTLDTVNGPIKLANGPHQLSIRIVDEGPVFITTSPITVTVRNADAALPVVAITSPAANETLSGTVKISGYAYVTTATGRIARGTLIVDQLPMGNIVLGGTQREVCAQLDNPRGCPNIGFEATLDTKLLGNGPHTLYVSVTDDRGQTVYAPAMSYLGLPFVVGN